jgi:hypothetical protein
MQQNDLSQTLTRKELADMLLCTVRTICHKEKTLNLQSARIPGTGSPGRGPVKYDAAKVWKLLGLEA